MSDKATKDKGTKRRRDQVDSDDDSDDDVPLVMSKRILKESKAVAETTTGQREKAVSSESNVWERLQKDKQRQFYSKSRILSLRHLSNFALVKPALEITASVLTDAKLPPEGAGSYASIEHFYQAMKYFLVGGPKAQGIGRRFQVNGEYGKDSALAKSKGGKSAMKSIGIQLDQKEWGQWQDAIMEVAVRGRAKVDEPYRLALVTAARNNLDWLHFDRSGARSYWGGNISKQSGKWVGKNRLGHIMTRVGRE